MLNEKDPAIAVILAFLFGPLGMIYCSFSLALMYFLFNCLLCFSIVGIPFLFFTWAGGAVHAYYYADTHNKQVRKLLNK